MKKCENCGKENLDEALFCAHCGLKLDSSLNSNSAKADDSDSNSIASSTEDSKSAPISSNSNGPTQNFSQRTFGSMKLWCCYLPIILFIVFIVFALVYHGFAEVFPVSYGHTYEYFDADGDGRLSLDEASQIDSDLSDSELREFFNEADTNNNGYLKGHEYELFYDDIKYYKQSLSESSSDNDKYKYSTSSSSSKGSDYSSSSKSTSSLNDEDYDSQDGYVLTCPYCGSEAVYETGGYYKCAECGSNIYNPDDLELAYSEGYMDLIATVPFLDGIFIDS